MESPQSEVLTGLRNLFNKFGPIALVNRETNSKESKTFTCTVCEEKQKNETKLKKRLHTHLLHMSIEGAFLLKH